MILSSLLLQKEPYYLRQPRQRCVWNRMRASFLYIEWHFMRLL
jgi:hypothetical protein